MAILSPGAYLRNVAQLALRGRSARGGDLPLPTNRIAVEESGIRILPRQLTRYLAATDGTQIAAFHGAEALLPPVFSSVWEAALALRLLNHSMVPPPTGGVIHRESECVPLRPLRLYDTFRCRLELERAEPDRRGIRLCLLSRTWNGAEQLCQENRSVLLLRTAAATERGGGMAEGGKAGRMAEEPITAWREITRWFLRGSHGRRYARASGDYNPIHLWSLTARPFGFRRPILHGFCIQALVAHALIAHRRNADPTRLRRLQTVFRSPLFLPATVALVVADTAHATQFRVVGAEGRGDGEVYAEGRFAGA